MQFPQVLHSSRVRKWLLVPLVVLLLPLLSACFVRALDFQYTLDLPAQVSAEFGRPVASGDVTGDGKADIVAVATGIVPSTNGDGTGCCAGEGRVYIYDGDTSLYVRILESPNPSIVNRFGAAVAVGDVNNDGTADVAVGAPGESGSSGRVRVYSGADGAILYTFSSPNSESFGEFGVSLAVADVNNDNKADVAVGAQGETVSGSFGAGRAYVFSGADGSLLHTISTPNPQSNSHFGDAVGLGDTNADNKADLVVGAPLENVGFNNDQGRAYVFSGADGSLLHTLNTPDVQSGANFGDAVAAADTNSDNNADVAVSAPGWDDGLTEDEGRAYVLNGSNGTLLLTLNNPANESGPAFGGTLQMGEVNGDGRADIAVSAHLEDVGPNQNEGSAYVFSGLDAAVIYTLNTPNPEAFANFSEGLAMGDTDGDGRADIIVGTPHEDVLGQNNQGRVYDYSGVNGTLRRTTDIIDFRTFAGFGISSAIGEVNGDGRQDVAVGSPGVGTGGRVQVFSSTSRAPIHRLQLPVPQAGAGFGGALAIGETNGDGRADIVVGAETEDVTVDTITYTDQGRVYVFSGANGALLHTLDSPNPEDNARFGDALATGDVNADGRADIAVGAPREDVGAPNQGRVYVFSGANGALLLTLDLPNPKEASFGSALAMGEMNGDAKDDICVGAHNEDVGANQDQGRVYCFSGSDGSLIRYHETPNPQPLAHFGDAVAMGDMNADGRADDCASAPDEDIGANQNQGRVYCFSGLDGTLLRTIDTPNPQADSFFGERLSMGNVNGGGENSDGNDDIAVTASGENSFAGRVYVFYGSDGSLQFTLDPPDLSTAVDFGQSIAVGDLTADANADVVVGDPSEEVFMTFDRQGRVHVHLIRVCVTDSKSTPCPPK